MADGKARMDKAQAALPIRQSSEARRESEADRIVELLEARGRIVAPVGLEVDGGSTAGPSA
jgi:hypothetical protein